MRGEPRSGAFRERVIRALCDLVRGFDGADREAAGDLLGPRDAAGLSCVLSGSVTALLRVMVVAFASARGLFAGVTAPMAIRMALEERRRRGEALERSHGGWDRLTETFRRVHVTWGGGLFDPARCAFLERGAPSDAAILAVLDGLLLDGGEPVSWADVEVEALGAAYEALLGLELRAATGDTLVLLPAHVGVDLEGLLAVPAPDRAARLAAMAGVTVRGRLAAALAAAGSPSALVAALGRRASPRWPGLVRRGALFVQPGEERRRAGAHYTPRSIAREVVGRALAPLLGPADLRDLRVCDPAMGSGAFLVEACRQLGDRLARAGVPDARRLVAERCLHGVDRDPLAVELARVSLWLVAEARERPLSFVDRSLRAGDALLGEGPPGGPGREAVERLCLASGRVPFHWPSAFPEVFSPPRAGFDAVVGNPPWVAYVGRAAQPLPADLFGFYRRHYPAFRGYRTLHGLFVQRAASLLRPGGRLGLVVPTSVSDLDGYAATRRAHDALCAVDPELADFGDVFAGVFQPAMGLFSTRRPGAPPEDGDEAPSSIGGESATWRVARDDLPPAARDLLARLAALPPLPAACFGERGYQTTGDDAATLAAAGAPAPPPAQPLREGAEVRSFCALPPRLHVDPSSLRGRLRAAEEWREVGLLVRQTARFPIAALADGVAFRNSILAGFAADGLDRFALCAWLNAAPIRWLHFMRYRDARQGMPQVKIGHLRSLPCVPEAHRATFHRLGEVLGTRNQGVTAAEQRELDDAAAGALALSDAERRLVAAWAIDHPAP